MRRFSFLRLTFLYFDGMLYMDKKSEPKMVGSAYLHGRKFRPYKQRSQTLMATVHAEKIVLAGAIFSYMHVRRRVNA